MPKMIGFLFRATILDLSGESGSFSKGIKVTDWLRPVEPSVSKFI